ncbi:secretion-regulating guanine nucleotide exchange factor-like [Montipora capricornis]|uniref:secretion-regulating guanine nucleotide exchange factor-like n=1 Tax=Montipora capricornis TaxID=246305 RepID=UPI0035F15399
MQFFSWGANSYGQLCLGHKEDVIVPQRCRQDAFPGNVEISLISGGGGHTAIITEKQDLFMCGWNSKGQLGLGHTDDKPVLCHVPVLAVVKQVSCGWNHTLAISDVGFYVWGSNSFGQLGIGKIGGYITRPTLYQKFANQQPVSIAAGLRHSAVALDDGSVWSWGANKKGQLGLGKPGNNQATPKQVVFQGSHGNIIQVTAGCHHTAALSAVGEVFCWGSNQHGQCGQPPDSMKTELDSSTFDVPHLIKGLISGLYVIRLESGWSHLLAVTDDMKVFAWGRADYGQLGLGDDVVKTRLCSDPTEVTLVKGAKQIVCGAEHNMALMGDGSVLTWGWNEHGICGTGNEVNVHTPGVVSRLEDSSVHLIGCGGAHSFAVINR